MPAIAGLLRRPLAGRVSVQYEEAITALKRRLIRYPNSLPAYAYLGAIYSELDREEEARAAMAEVWRISPQTQQGVSGWRLPYKDHAVYERLRALWATVPQPDAAG